MEQRLGPYELEAEIGRGGMGRVYRARHLPTGVARAVKVLEGVPDEETVKRFQREASALARAGGRGVVNVHESGVENRRFFIGMDLMPGGSLRTRISKQGRLPWREAAQVVAKVARTLESLAPLSLVHRDVKPDNILFDDAGEPRLADFGCVRDLSASRLTQSGITLGTMHYMAPEQLLGDPIDSRADVFSLAVTLYQLVTGLVPHGGRSPEALVEAIRARKRTAASRIATSPRALDAILERAFAYRRESRSTAGALASELEGLIASAKDGGEEPARGRWLAFSLVTVGVAVAGLAGLVVATSGGDPPRPSATSTKASVASVATKTTAPPRSPDPRRKEAVQAARTYMRQRRYEDALHRLEPWVAELAMPPPDEDARELARLLLQGSEDVSYSLLDHASMRRALELAQARLEVSRKLDPGGGPVPLAISHLAVTVASGEIKEHEFQNSAPVWRALVTHFRALRALGIRGLGFYTAGTSYYEWTWLPSDERITRVSAFVDEWTKILGEGELEPCEECEVLAHRGEAILLRFRKSQDSADLVAARDDLVRSVDRWPEHCGDQLRPREEIRFFGAAIHHLAKTQQLGGDPRAALVTHRRIANLEWLDSADAYGTRAVLDLGWGTTEDDARDAVLALERVASHRSIPPDSRPLLAAILEKARAAKSAAERRELARSLQSLPFGW